MDFEDRPTDRPTDQPTERLLEAPSWSLKVVIGPKKIVLCGRTLAQLNPLVFLITRSWFDPWRDECTYLEKAEIHQISVLHLV